MNAKLAHLAKVDLNTSGCHQFHRSIFFILHIRKQMNPTIFCLLILIMLDINRSLTPTFRYRSLRIEKKKNELLFFFSDVKKNICMRRGEVGSKTELKSIEKIKKVRREMRGVRVQYKFLRPQKR